MEPACEFRYDRGKLTIYAAGALMFVALGCWLVWFAAPSRFDTWLSVVNALLWLPGAALGAVTIYFFGSIFIVAAAAVMDRAPVITLCDSFVHDRRWGGPVVPWADIQSVSGVVIVAPDDEVAISATVSILVADTSRYYQPGSAFARLTYGTMRNPLYFNMSALDGTALDLARQLVALRPDKVARVGED